jgi:hypothetical protein
MKIESKLKKVFESMPYEVSIVDRWGSDFRVILLTNKYTMLSGVEVLSVYERNIQLIIRHGNVAAFLERYGD